MRTTFSVFLAFSLVACGGMNPNGDAAVVDGRTTETSVDGFSADNIEVDTPDAMQQMPTDAAIEDASSETSVDVALTDATPDVAVVDVASDVVADAGMSSLPAPRMLFPLSGSRVTSARPFLRWSLPSGVDGARVEFCRDRACSMTLRSQEFRGESGTVSEDLPTGAVYFRAFGLSGSMRGTQPSAVWSLRVPAARTAMTPPVATAHRVGHDVDLDGYDDLVRASTFDVYVHRGSATGVATESTWMIPGPAGAGSIRSAAWGGDLDGDGFAELVVLSGSVYVFRGGASGPQMTPTWTIAVPPSRRSGFSEVWPAGDLNGDGYGDLLVAAESFVSPPTMYVYFGGASGPSTTPSQTITGRVNFGESVAAGCDLNGDRFMDAVLRVHNDEVRLYFGSAMGLPSMPSVTWTPTQVRHPGGTFRGFPGCGDFDGDGRAEALIAYSDMDGGGFFAAPHDRPEGASGYGSSSAMGNARIEVPGDVNGDGLDDVLSVTLLGTTSLLSLYVGSGDTRFVSATSATVLISSPDFGSNLELSSLLRGAGDLQGDGRADFRFWSIDSMSRFTWNVYYGGAMLPMMPSVVLR